MNQQFPVYVKEDNMIARFEGDLGVGLVWIKIIEG